MSMESNRMSNFNSSIVDLITKNDEMVERSKTNRIKEIERSYNNLYLTSYTKKEKQDIITKEYKKIKDQNELLNCSFKPSFITPKKPIEGEIIKLGFFERRDQFKQKTTEK